MLGSFPQNSKQFLDPTGTVVKNQLASTGDTLLCSILGSGGSLGVVNYNPVHYSCLGNPMDRGAWWATTHEVAKLDTTAQGAHTHTHTHTRWCPRIQLSSDAIYPGIAQIPQASHSVLSDSTLPVSETSPKSGLSPVLLTNWL